jgi:hypothetical protein
MQGLIIEPHYIPNLRYFSKFLISNCIIIDDLSLFRKQSYRNRANILSVNGILPLIVPVCKGRSKIIFKDIRIDNTLLWQKTQWNSIVSAYNKSAYFQFYKHLFAGYYEKRYVFLLDLNLDIIRTIATILSLPSEIILFSDFTGDVSEYTDQRNSIDPKPRYNKADDMFTSIIYSQVFSDRFEFVSDLSIIDLIFNHGPDTTTILQQSVITMGKGINRPF